VSSAESWLDTHRVWAALENARTWLTTVEETAKSGGLEEDHRRLRRVLDFANERLQSADPDLVAASAVESMASSLDQLATELQNFSSSGNAAHISGNARQYADSLVANAVAYLYVPATPRELEEAQAAATSYRRSLGQLARNASGEIEELRGAVDSLRNSVAAEEAQLASINERLDGVVGTAQAQFAEVQSQGQIQIADAVTEGRKALQDAVATAEDELRESAQSAREQLVKVVEGSQEKLDAELGRVKARADTQMAELDELLERAIKTVNAIGSTGMSGGYQIAADRHEKQANHLRLVALGALITAIGLAVALGFVFGFEDFSWEAIVTKSFVSVPLLVLAGYAATESSRHREQARVNRHIELQLASIDSYMAAMPGDEQNRVKMELADRFFGQVPGKHEPQIEDPGVDRM
jgi:hypothetical protein